MERDMTDGMPTPDETVISYHLLRDVLEHVEESIEMGGPCDHSVNICVCGMKTDADLVRRVLGLPARWFPVTPECLEGDES